MPKYGDRPFRPGGEEGLARWANQARRARSTLSPFPQASAGSTCSPHSRIAFMTLSWDIPGNFMNN